MKIQTKLAAIYHILIFIFIIQLSGTHLAAQNDTVHDVEYYLDEGVLSEKKNLIKLNVLSAIQGDLSFHYERIFGRVASIEVGAGLILPFYIPDIPELFLGDTVVINPTSGRSIWICPKYYLQHKAPEFNYLGIQFRQRHYNQGIYQYVYTDITFNFGLQLPLWDRFIFDYEAGAGFRFKHENSGNSDYESINSVLSVSFKIGYLF